MKYTTLLFAILAVVSEAYAPLTPKKVTTTRTTATKTSPNKNAFTADFKKTAASIFTVATLASHIIATPVAALDSDNSIFTSSASLPSSSFGSSSTTVAEKVVREGLYKDYEVEIEQKYDQADSTFKSAKETKTKKGKYTAILAILIVGSFIVPMAQYFWYVRDDDSSEQFFGQKKAPEPEPPKKKGWFN